MWWILYILIGIAAVWLIATIAIVASLFFGSLSRKRTKKSGLDTSDLVSCLKPFKDEIDEGKRWYRAQNLREAEIISYDGVRLRADIFEAENAVGTLILMHGFRSSAINDFTLVFPFYHNLGFNLVIPDQRACGRSEGKYITLGIKERYDCKAWTDFAAKEFGENLPLILDGISMGATTVMMASALDLPKNVCGLIADCGFTSPLEVVHAVLRATHIPAFPNIYFAKIFARLFAGFGFSEASTIDAMKTCQYPILFAHGKKDDFVPYEMTVQNFEACASEKKAFFSVDEAGHGMCYLLEREKLQKELTLFLEQCVENFHRKNAQSNNERNVRT